MVNLPATTGTTFDLDLVLINTKTTKATFDVLCQHKARQETSPV